MRTYVMKNYVLVHGAWGSAAEFDEMLPALSENGNNVVAVDLPGHGKNVVPISKVTMAAYIQRVVKVVNQQDSKVVLVGHSLAGAVISQVAEVIPEKLEKLIYVAAMLPKTGDTAMGLMQSDEKGELLKRIKFSDDESYATISADDVRDIFLHDIENKDRVDTLIPDYLIKQATQPFMAPIVVTQKNLGSIPKYYIRAALDKVLTPTLQDQMISNWKVEQVFTLDSGHFPTASLAKELSSLILEIN